MLRLESPGKEKAILPVAPVEGGYQIGDPPGLWPLLYEPDVVQDGGLIVVCEGEPKADLVRWDCMAFLPFSAKSPKKTDWRILSGQIAVLLDNDPRQGSNSARPSPGSSWRWTHRQS